MGPGRQVIACHVQCRLADVLGVPVPFLICFVLWWVCMLLTYLLGRLIGGGGGQPVICLTGHETFSQGISCDWTEVTVPAENSILLMGPFVSSISGSRSACIGFVDEMRANMRNTWNHLAFRNFAGFSSGVAVFVLRRCVVRRPCRCQSSIADAASEIFRMSSSQKLVLFWSPVCSAF